MADRRELSSRLAWLRQQGDLRPASQVPEPVEGASGKRDEGAEAIARSLGFRAAGRYTLEREVLLPNPIAALAPPFLLDPTLDGHERLTFIDTETTGLSGGAGNVAFLVGIGQSAGGAFRIRQFFLTDFPGEHELLQTIAPSLGPERTLVSFNGKSFDLPLLRTRFVMNGMRLLTGAHIDLLHPARRLWGSVLDSCALHVIEERVLGIEREEDVPSMEVPELYFRFLRTGNPQVVRPVFSHHLYDVSSLAALFALLERFGRSLRDGPTVGVPPDPYALALFCLERDAPGAIERLESLARARDPRAAQTLGKLYRRRGEHEKAAAVWRRLWENGSRYAGVELAKHLEHRAGDPGAALEIVKRLSLAPARGFPDEERMRSELLTRRARLERKVKNVSEGSGEQRSRGGRR